MKNVLIQYVRRRGKPVGCLVAVKREDGEIVIEYSLCRKTDKYDKILGRNIAIARAKKSKDGERTLPQSLRVEMQDFIKRCERYYQKSATEMVGYI
jgi:hypothetical protein